MEEGCEVKRGIESRRKVKVLVIVEGESVENHMNEYRKDDQTV